MTPRQLIFAGNHPSNSVLTCLSQSTRASTAWTVLVSPAPHLSTERQNF